MEFCTPSSVLGQDYLRLVYKMQNVRYTHLTISLAARVSLFILPVSSLGPTNTCLYVFKFRRKGKQPEWRLIIARTFAMKTPVDFAYRWRPFVQPLATVWTTYHCTGSVPKSHRQKSKIYRWMRSTLSDKANIQREKINEITRVRNPMRKREALDACISWVLFHLLVKLIAISFQAFD